MTRPLLRITAWPPYAGLVTVTVIGTSPFAVQVCEPETSKPPPGRLRTVPADDRPSPQSIVAVKSPGCAVGSRSNREPTTPLNGWSISVVIVRGVVTSGAAELSTTRSSISRF